MAYYMSYSRHQLMFGTDVEDCSSREPLQLFSVDTRTHTSSGDHSARAAAPAPPETLSECTGKSGDGKVVVPLRRCLTGLELNKI